MTTIADVNNHQTWQISSASPSVSSFSTDTNSAVSKPEVSFSINFTNTQPIDVTVTDLAFGGAFQGFSDSQLKALFAPTIINNSGLNWTGFRIALVDVDSRSTGGDQHPPWAHFHDSTFGGWLNPDTGVFPYNANEGYDRTTQLSHIPYVGLSSLNGASELRLSGGTFANGSTEKWSDIGIHEWGEFDNGMLMSTANSFVIELTPIAHKSTNDFNGDNTSDILWQNGGTVIDWIMHSGKFQSSNLVWPDVGAGWQTAGTGDFTGDGAADILWQNGDTVIDWIMQNGKLQSSNLLPNAAPGWHAVGTGDFTGDGAADILWQNGGAVIDWIMQNGKFQSSNLLSANVGTGWQVVGTGDFNVDGLSDILWQNGGAVIDWTMQNGQQLQSSHLLSPDVGTGWKVVGTGDFNGDGAADILWQNGGTVIDWIMQNGQLQSSHLLSPNVGGGWQVAETADFTGDGTDDILWQNGGAVIDWTMQNGQVQFSNLVSSNVGAGWQVVGGRV